MGALKIAISVLFIIGCLVLIIIVLAQEGKSAGLSGSISGGSESFWNKNKSRSMEGKLENVTKLLIAAFFVFSLILNII